LNCLTAANAFSIATTLAMEPELMLLDGRRKAWGTKGRGPGHQPDLKVSANPPSLVETAPDNGSGISDTITVLACGVIAGGLPSVKKRAGDGGLYKRNIPRANWKGH
jgi:hypothetical protein